MRLSGCLAPTRRRRRQTKQTRRWGPRIKPVISRQARLSTSRSRLVLRPSASESMRHVTRTSRVLSRRYSSNHPLRMAFAVCSCCSSSNFLLAILRLPLLKYPSDDEDARAIAPHLHLRHHHQQRQQQGCVHKPHQATSPGAIAPLQLHSLSWFVTPARPAAAAAGCTAVIHHLCGFIFGLAAASTLANSDILLNHAERQR